MEKWNRELEEVNERLMERLRFCAKISEPRLTTESGHGGDVDALSLRGSVMNPLPDR